MLSNLVLLDETGFLTILLMGMVHMRDSHHGKILLYAENRKSDRD